MVNSINDFFKINQTIVDVDQLAICAFNQCSKY